jgi:ABC-type sugar transport system substrate-binding protein
MAGPALKPGSPSSDWEAESREAEAAARTLGVRLIVEQVRTPDEFDRVLENLAAQKVDGLLPAADSLFAGANTRRAALSTSTWFDRHARAWPAHPAHSSAVPQ